MPCALCEEVGEARDRQLIGIFPHNHLLRDRHHHNTLQLLQERAFSGHLLCFFGRIFKSLHWVFDSPLRKEDRWQ